MQMAISIITAKRSTERSHYRQPNLSLLRFIAIYLNDVVCVAFTHTLQMRKLTR